MSFKRLGSFLLAALPALALGAGGARRDVDRSKAAGRAEIESLEGSSVLNHLKISLDDSALGRVGAWPPLAASKDQAPWGESSGPEPAGGPFVLSGADIYRLTCQSCHKPDGTGVPPEIRSVVGPVRATSAALLRQQMKERGVAMDETMIRQLSAQAQVSLHDRMQNGGEKMPPFGFLTSDEKKALEAYLMELAGVPLEGHHSSTVTEPIARVGELLVKGTCHVCHDDAPTIFSAWPLSPEDSAIPPLATIVRQRTVNQVIRKVHEGAAESAPMMTSGRMPRMTYLTAEEIGAGYYFVLQHTSHP